MYSFFSSNKNINIINSIINNDIQKELNSIINNEHKDIILKNISFVQSKVSKNTPKGFSDQEYLILMNQKVYDLSYPTIKNNILLNNKKEQTPIINKNISKEIIKSSDNQFDQEIIKSYNLPSIIDYPKPGNEQKINVGNQFEKVQNEREALLPKQKEINFQENYDENSSNTLNLYNDLLGTYNQQLMNMEEFENKQLSKNKSIEEYEEYENIQYENNKTTPISQLFNQEKEKIVEDTINTSMDNIVSFNRNDAEILKLSNEQITLLPSQQNDGEQFSSVTNSMSNIMLKEPKFKLIEKDYNIVIDSRYRNLEIYPNSNEFQFKFSPDSNNYLYKNYIDKNGTFIIREKNIVTADNNSNNIGEIYDNIISIELKSLIVPSFSFEYFFKTENNILKNDLNIFRENYLLLDIPEIKGPYQGGGNSIIRNSFAKLNLSNSIVQSNIIVQYFTSLIIEDQYFKYSPVTHGKLDKMTLRLNNKNGRLYNFGIDKLFIQNFSVGSKRTNLCGSYEGTKFELIMTNQEYTDYCNYYYDICSCQKINNTCTCECKLSLNPIDTGDLIYFYNIIPNNDQCVFFENIVTIENLNYDISNKLITLKLNYQESSTNNKKKKKFTNVNFEDLFANFDIYSPKNFNYYFLFVLNNNSYYVKILNINKTSIDLEYYEGFPEFDSSDYSKIKIGIAKPNLSGSSSENKQSLFYINGYNVYKSSVIKENDQIKFEIEIEYPFYQLPNYIQKNYFSNNDIFLIQDKHQLVYTFQIKTHIKDYEHLDSSLNESGNF